MDNKSEVPYEEKTVRCPRLGCEVLFSFCSSENEDQPCSKCLQCWTAVFDVAKYFRESMDDATFDACFTGKIKPRMETLLELIERSKKLIHADENAAKSDTES